MSERLQTFQTKLAKDEARWKTAGQVGKRPEHSGVDYHPALICSLRRFGLRSGMAFMAAGPETHSSQFM